jgi:hypothetical protein
MIERIERAAPLRVPAAIHFSRRRPHARPAGSVLAMTRGEIAGDVRLLERSDRDRTATYEVLVANETAGPLAAFAYAVEAGRGSGRGPGRMTWNAIVVPPHSAIAVEIEITIPRRGRPPRVVAEVHSEDAQLTLDSAPPLARYSPYAVKRAALLAAAFVVAMGSVGGAVAARPRVAALAAPPSVATGSAFSVAYAMSNASGGEYTIEDRDGLQLRRGKLPGGSGAFTIALPVDPVAGGYDLHVFAHGRFGNDERSMHIATAAPPAPSDGAPSVKIAKLRLASDTVVAGMPIRIAYRTPARTGSVRLIDEYGTVRAEALLNRTGTSLLVAPFVDADQDLRIVVTAESGAERDEAQIPVRVLHAPAPAAGGLADASGNVPAPAVPALAPLDGPAPAAIVAGAAPASVPAPLPASVSVAETGDTSTGVRHAVPLSDGSPIGVARTQSADAPIVVQVLRYEPKMHVAVLGNSGEELEGADVSPGDRVVSLSSPHELGTKRPSIVATYMNGSEQETVIRRVGITRARK